VTRGIGKPRANARHLVFLNGPGVNSL